MFDAVLNGDAAQPRPLGPAAAISVLIHALAFALIAWASTRTPALHRDGQAAITFMAGRRALAPPIGPPLRSLAGKASLRHELTPTKKRSLLRPSTESLAQRPAESKPPQQREKEVLAALAKQKFKPVTFQGRPVSVDYVFNIRLVLPRY